MERKTCTKCKESKPVSEFTGDRGRKDGLHSWCKSCVKEQHAKYRSDNLESEKARSRRYNDENKAASYRRELEGTNPTSKTCTRCGKVKSSSEFSRNRGRKDGLFDWCKECHKEGRGTKKGVSR